MYLHVCISIQQFFCLCSIVLLHKMAMSPTAKGGHLLDPWEYTRPRGKKSLHSRYVTTSKG